MTRTTLARYVPVVVLVCAIAGNVTAQNVGSYGMATKPPPPTPETFEKMEISEETQKKILGTTPPLDGTWFDHTGASVSLREVIGGKPTILVPIYIRCPQLCSLTIENLMSCLRQMREKDREMTPGKAFNLVFFSIDDHEHPRIAAPRRELFHGDLDGRSSDEPGVWFLSANRGQFSDPSAADRTIREVTDAIGYHFVKADKKGREIQHPTAVLVLTPTGRVSSYNTAISFDARELIGQVETAADEKMGTTSPLAALACFLGTEPSGLYRTAMRILGGVSVPVLLAVGGVVFLNWRRAQRDAKLTAPDTPGVK